jgi:membrane protein DedA with SNARE-associated domain
MAGKSEYLKRFLNLIFIGCLLWTALVAYVVIVGLVVGGNMEGWFDYGLVPLFWLYAGLAGINYLLFGRVIFWHRSQTKSQG